MESKFSIYLTDFWINHGIQCELVINAGGTWCTFQPQIRKTKKNYPEKISYIFLKKIFFIYFRMEFSRPNQKNFLIFWERTFDSQSWKTTKKLLWKNFLYFSEKKIPVFLDFGIELSSPKPEKQKKIAMKKFLIFFWKKVFSFILQLNFPTQIPSFFQFYNFFFWCIGMELSSPKPKKQNKTHPEKVFSKKSSPHAHQKKAQIFQAKIVSYNYWKGRGAYEKTPI